ncbi:MAG: aspartate kinase, partial [Nanoarchaeota archaeon]|nr:aspartate kinase [Nanoarchaeota archaeon]
VISMTKSKNKKIEDHIFFFGERMSVKILAQHLSMKGIKAESRISGDVGMITNSEFGAAEILDESFEKINYELTKIKGIPIITGFGGKDCNGEFTTFSRGGSDYVASLIGAAVQAERIEIWTEVNGVMTTNPQIVKEAKTIPLLTFNEASELAYFGAKVLHPKTIIPAINKNIPVKVLNTFEPENEGSTIVCDEVCTQTVKAISYKRGIIIIDVKSSRMLNAHGFLAKIFEVFAKYKKSVDMIATSEIKVSMSIDCDDNLRKIIRELKKIANVKISKNKAIICVVGQGINNNIFVTEKIFGSLREINTTVEMVSQCYDNVSINLVIENSKVEKTVKCLHKELIQL